MLGRKLRGILAVAIGVAVLGVPATAHADHEGGDLFAVSMGGTIKSDGTFTLDCSGFPTCDAVSADHDSGDSPGDAEVGGATVHVDGTYTEIGACGVGTITGTSTWNEISAGLPTVDPVLNVYASDSYSWPFSGAIVAGIAVAQGTATNQDGGDGNDTGPMVGIFVVTVSDVTNCTGTLTAVGVAFTTA